MYEYLLYFYIRPANQKLFLKIKALLYYHDSPCLNFLMILRVKFTRAPFNRIA